MIQKSKVKTIPCQVEEKLNTNLWASISIQEAYKLTTKTFKIFRLKPETHKPIPIYHSTTANQDDHVSMEGVGTRCDSHIRANFFSSQGPQLLPKLGCGKRCLLHEQEPNTHNE